MKRNLLIFLVLVFSACSPTTGTPQANPQAQIDAAVQATLTAWPTNATVVTTGSGAFFDDFNYTRFDDPSIKVRGWTPRSEAGGPGVPGAKWSAEAVSFIDDPELSGNRLMQLTSSTDGTPANTVQTEFFQQRKFYEGTYATRVRFSDAPISGPDGDTIVETFFTITPLHYNMEPDYGEIDFEYLPNGGWGANRNTFWLTTWETYQGDPWQAENTHDSFPISFDGWHTLVAQVSGVRVKYYIDGALLAEHGDKYYPETPMSFNFNQWFIDGGLVKESTLRQYVQQADWVYYAGNETLTPKQVDERVAAYRTAKVAHADTVPAWTAPVVTIPTTPTPAAAGPRPFEQVVHKVSAIKVDGDLADWKSDPTFTLDQQSQLVYIASGAKWDGAKDFSALLWAGWSDDGLYVAAKVTDDQVVQSQTGINIWQGDYFEIQLDTDLEGDYDDTKMSDDDFQLGFSPGDFGKTPPVTFVWAGSIPDARIKDILQAQVKTDDGYIVEAFIPKDLLPKLIFKEGSVFGMNINPSESDGPPQEMMMSPSAKRALGNPTTFGKITLVK